MFSRRIGTELTMFYRAWSAQLELAGTGPMVRLVLTTQQCALIVSKYTLHGDMLRPMGLLALD